MWTTFRSEEIAKNRPVSGAVLFFLPETSTKHKRKKSYVLRLGSLPSHQMSMQGCPCEKVCKQPLSEVGDSRLHPPGPVRTRGSAEACSRERRSGMGAADIQQFNSKIAPPVLSPGKGLLG